MFRRSTLLACLVVVYVVKQHMVDASINDRCNVNDECNIQHSYCQRVHDEYGLCTCLKGYTTSRNGRECLQVLGQTTCTVTGECHVIHAICDVNTKQCDCSRGYLASRDKTQCLPPLGRSCQDNSECLAFVAHSLCHLGTCTCNAQYLASPSQTECLPLLGKRCDADANCAAFKDAYCDNGVCACRPADHVTSLNKTTCLPLVSKLLDSCEEDLQCTNQHLGQDTFCLNHRCSCRYGYTNAHHSCEKRRVLHDSCNHTQQCQMIAHASCVHHKCTCDSNYVLHATDRMQCVPRVQLVGAGAPCMQEAQCKADYGDTSRCSSGTCQCFEDHHLVNEATPHCVKNKGITQRCAQQGDCYLPLDGIAQNIECANSACACKSGFIPSHASDSCYSGSTKLHSFLSVVTLLTSILVAWR